MKLGYQVRRKKCNKRDTDSCPLKLKFIAPDKNHEQDSDISEKKVFKQSHCYTHA